MVKWNFCPYPKFSLMSCSPRCWARGSAWLTVQEQAKGSKLFLGIGTEPFQCLLGALRYSSPTTPAQVVELE